MSKRTSRKRKLPTEVWVALIGLAGVIITGILSSLLIISLVQQRPSPTDTLASTSTVIAAEPTLLPLASPLNAPTSTSQLSAPILAGTLASPTGSCPLVLDFGALIYCEIGQKGGINIHNVQAVQGDQIYYSVMKIGTGTPFTLHVVSSDPTGQTLSDRRDDNIAERVVGALNSGTYTIRVEDQNLANTGQYALYVQRLNNPSKAQPLIIGQPLFGSIKLAFQHDVYTFDASAGDHIIIEITETPPVDPLELRAIVYRSDGKDEFANHSDITVSLDFTATSTGTYTIVVYDYLLNNIGDYRIIRLQ